MPFLLCRRLFLPLPSAKRAFAAASFIVPLSSMEGALLRPLRENFAPLKGNNFFPVIPQNDDSDDDDSDDSGAIYFFILASKGYYLLYLII